MREGAGWVAHKPESLVVDIPFQKLLRGLREGDESPLKPEEGLNGAPIPVLEVLEEERPQCERMLVDGRRCSMPAHEGWRECYRHGRWYAALPASLGMPYPEDAVAIQELLGRAVAMVMNREITPQQASVIARLCGEMRQNLWAFQQEMRQSETEMERKRASRGKVV